MSGERIRSERDARDLTDEYRVRKPGKSNAKVRVGARPDHRMAGTGMDGFEFDPAAMARAQGKLEMLRNELAEHRRTAIELAEDLPDGSSPVARRMRQVFLQRADPETGVQAVLKDYLVELQEIQTAIDLTLKTYAAMDANATAVLRAADDTRPGEGD
ncbi:MAG TPA: hypothetical protein VGX25_03385 [Actinophytocola sp.]|uniref:hypothetical protein n=1 Tax=Actinophytocola sp. TaxID=1872138 RepID=UPI002DDD7EA6|nr:hypothetical protein [Actinophytocola sp.]HEV2778422.1 hypothetical protein [Actinophytocola sp.]